MDLFWLTRMKQRSASAGWALPYGDLMSLLLAVFVMIAALSELKAGPRFDEVAGGVKQAFGFEEPTVPHVTEAVADKPRRSLVQRLGAADPEPGRSVVIESPPAGSGLTMTLQRDANAGRLTVALSAEQVFGSEGMTVKPIARPALAKLAAELARGRNRIEVSACESAGPGADHDGWVGSFGRARAVADVLVRAGVSRERLSLRTVPLRTGARIAIAVEPIPADEPGDGGAARDEVGPMNAGE